MKNIESFVKYLVVTILVILLAGCWKSVDWEKELFVTDSNEFDFKGQIYSESSQGSSVNCPVRVELIPQTHYGFRNTSQKGPYKLKVLSVGNHCSDINVLSIEVFGDSQGKELIVGNYEKKGLLQHAETKLYFHVYSDVISVSISKTIEIFIRVKIDSDNSKNSVFLFKLIPKKVQGKTKIPIFTT